MWELIVSPTAAQDMESVLAWSEEWFGSKARLRYEKLLQRALRDVAKDPYRAGSHDMPEICLSARTYHVSHSRDRRARASDRVKNPRHLLLYRVGEDGIIEVGRVLHESMDLLRHLPGDYLD